MSHGWPGRPVCTPHTGVRLVKTIVGDVYSVREGGTAGLVLHNECGPAFVAVSGECVYYVDGVKHRPVLEGPAVVRCTRGSIDEFWERGVQMVVDGETFRPWGSGMVVK